MEEERATKRVKLEHHQKTNNNQHRRTGKWKNHKPQTKGKASISSSGIHNDDVGVFVTCSKGQEKRCLDELNDLFMQYLEEDDYAETLTNGGCREKQQSMIDDMENQRLRLLVKGDNKNQPHPCTDDGHDVEADIEAELTALRDKTVNEDKLKLVTLDVSCVCFVKTGKGIDPVRLVHQICSDAYDDPEHQRSRYIKRMTPMSLIRKTLSGGLEDVCHSVLEPHFGPGRPTKKFAIRPTIRNNHDLDRETVIKTVARAVGNGHSVDLKNYDSLILVDVCRNVCGMSVVGNNYEKLKRYNLAEIYSPTPRPDLNQGHSTKGKGDVSTDPGREIGATASAVPANGSPPDYPEAETAGDSRRPHSN